jgi:hypothetical protein
MSSTKRVVKNHHIIVNGDMSASIDSEVIDSTSLDHLVIEVIWSAGTSPTGSVTLQGSVTGENWASIGSAVTVSGASGSGFNRTTFNEPVYPFPLTRVRWNRTGGSGTLNVHLAAKEN